MAAANVRVNQVLLRRGNTAAASTYTGPAGEVIVDTGLNTLRVQNGVTAGGTILATNAQIWSLSNTISTITGIDTSLLSNAATQQTQINIINANLGAFETYANATFGTATYGDANVKSYLTAFDGNIIPSANVAYSLGDATHQWRDLWVSNNTIYIGNTPIRVEGGTLLVNNAPIVSTGNISFIDTTVSAPVDGEIIVAAKDAQRDRATLRLEPTSGDAYLEAWSGQNTRSENDTNWTTGVWENNIYGNPNMTFTGAFDLAFFVVNTLQSGADPDTVSFSINGEPYIAWDGGSSADTTTGYVQIYTSGVSPNVSPTAITTLEWRYAYKSSIAISNGSGAMQLTGRNQSLQINFDQYIQISGKDSIELNNSNSGNNVDIELRSGDDIILQAKDKTTSDSEGGDITINAGRGGDADAGDSAGGGGDITIRAGQGGSPSAQYNGGLGGTIDLYGGTGGNADSGLGRSARDGGRARLIAGSAGSNSGNVELGATGGPIEITAGQTTLANTNGGTVTITSGLGGSNALAGYVEINIPSSDLGQGGSWYFTGSGRTLEAPQDSEIWQPNLGNLSVASAGNVFVRSYDGSQHEWQFGYNGRLRTPSSLNVSPYGLFAPVGGTVIHQDTDQMLSIVSNGTSGATTTIGWYQDFNTSGNLAVIGMNALDSGGVGITTGDENATIYNWVFDKYGNLSLPGNVTNGSSQINFVANSSGDGNGYSTIQIRPDAELYTDQYIIVDPTGGEPGHIHLRAGGTQDASGADLYLGGELTAVRVSDTSGIVTVRTTNIGDPNITMDWSFQPDGNLYFPGIGNNRIGESEPGLVVTSDNSVVLQANNSGNINEIREWTFGADGDLSFPTGGSLIFDSSATSTIDGVTNISASGTIGANVIQVLSDLTSFGASPAPVIYGFRSISTTGSAVNEGNISASGNLVASRNAYVTGNIFAASYNFANGVNILDTISGVTSISSVVNTSILSDVSGDYQYGTLDYSYAVNGNNGQFAIQYSFPLVYGNVDVNVGNVIASNVTTTNGIFWANGQAYSTGGGSYGNTEVAAYLPTYSGNAGAARVQVTNAVDFMYGGYPYMGWQLSGSDTLKLRTNIASGDYTHDAIIVDRQSLAVNVVAQLTAASVSTGNITITGNAVQQSAYYETYANVVNSGGNLTCNFVNGGTFYATLTGNVTANFTNVAVTTGTIVGATIIVDQGVTPYQVTNVQVNGGSVQQVKWAGGTGINVGTGSNTDVMSFSLINLGGGAWRVLGQIANYG